MSSGSSCPNCGISNYDNMVPCDDCGHFRIGRLRVRNGSSDVGMISIRTVVGRGLLIRWLGIEEGQFANTVQYTFHPDPARGWTIIAARGCLNPTLINGKSIEPDTEHPLIDGMFITVGSARARIDIQIVREP